MRISKGLHRALPVRSLQRVLFYQLPDVPGCFFCEVTGENRLPSCGLRTCQTIRMSSPWRCLGWEDKLSASISRQWRTEVMANPELLTLAKALSVKNRLAGRLAQARSNIETYNSVLAGQRDDYGKATVDVRAEYDRYRKLQDGLIVVKAAIQRASLPIYEDILQLGELKSVIQMLSGLNTKNEGARGYSPRRPLPRWFFLVHDAGAVSTFIVHRIKLQRSRLNPQMPMLRGWPVVCVFLGRCVFDEE